MRSLPLLFLFALSACAAPPAKPATVRVPPGPSSSARTAAKAPAPPPPAPTLPRGAAFGGDRWGFVEASSADGRLVVLRRFEGDARPRFGQHGDSGSPTHLAVFDAVTGTERAVDELIDVEPSRRWFVLIENGQLSIADAHSGVFDALPGADMAGDENRCLAPRMAGFSPKGKRVGWLTAGGLRVRDLASGSEWLVKGQGRLWRGWPDDDRRGATLLEIAAAGTDWPRQRTSCACRWCGRFAMSYGVYGWDGPAFDVTSVAEDGSRSKADPDGAEHRWHGPSDAGCTVEPTSDEDDLERGPWQWRCPGAH